MTAHRAYIQIYPKRGGTTLTPVCLCGEHGSPWSTESSAGQWIEEHLQQHASEHETVAYFQDNGIRVGHLVPKDQDTVA